MTRVQDVMGILEKIAPKRLAEDWDNVGLLVGNPISFVRKIYVTLDVTEELIEEAIDEGVNLLVAHHPILFRPMKTLRTDTPLGRMLEQLMIGQIAVLAAHTNLDSASGGVNDVLAECLGLYDVVPLQPARDDETVGLGRIGNLKQTLVPDVFVQHVKDALQIEHLRVVDSNVESIKKVAVCGGAGAEFIDRAVFLGADAFVTGDVKYHDGQRAKERSLFLIDAGHKATEELVIESLANEIEKGLAPDTKVVVKAKYRTDDWIRYV